MKLVSLNVGRPQRVEWRGKSVLTSIFKTPVSGVVHVGELNVDGDEQADLSVHGGADKAVYAYPTEHHAYWRERLPGVDLPWGAFGENFSTAGLSEDSLYIGDRLTMGTAEFLVTQPRMPCFKLGLRFGRTDMVKLFQHSGRTGFYLAVLRQGEVQAGDTIELHRGGQGVTVAQIARLYTTPAAAATELRRASELPALPESWRAYFRNRLASLEA